MKPVMERANKAIATSSKIQFEESDEDDHEISSASSSEDVGISEAAYKFTIFLLE